jgi:hypothetical protein
MRRSIMAGANLSVDNLRWNLGPSQSQKGSFLILIPVFLFSMNRKATA